MQPLETIDNPTAWSALLDLALPALDEAGVEIWTLGGGTAMALRIGHRLSDDVDIFVPGVPLRRLAPANNAATRAISSNFQWPGFYLKFIRPEGEIDFLGAALQTEPGFTMETFRGRPVRLETIEEVIVKKIRFRAGTFTPRDAFDLVAAQRAIDVPGILAEHVADRLDVLETRLRMMAHASALQMTPIRATPAFADIVAPPYAAALAMADEAIALAAKAAEPSSANGWEP